MNGVGMFHESQTGGKTRGQHHDLLAGARWWLSRKSPDSAESGESSEAGETANACPARVPGTVTGALRDAVGSEAAAELVRQNPDETVWELSTTLITEGGYFRFFSHGVAPVARLVVNGVEVHASDSAFEPWDVPVELPTGESSVVLRVLPLNAVAVPRKPRARWLSPLVRDRSIRWRRTPLIGHIDWPGAQPVMGPWGGLELRAQSAVSNNQGPRPSSVRASVDEHGNGLVTVEWDADDFRTATGGQSTWDVEVTATCEGAEAGDLIGLRETICTPHAKAQESVRVELGVPAPRLWWPHGMGEAALYQVTVCVGSSESVHTVGFRTVAAEPRSVANPGLALRLNGIPILARGAVWAGTDPFEVAADPSLIRTRLQRLRDAGATMVRIPGTACYETPAFHRACDELGLMVWQDIALGPMDPPDDPTWRDGLLREITALATRLGEHPSTVVISGGTEVIQAPVLAGRPREQWIPEVLLRELPQGVAASGADVIVVPSSPCSDMDLDAAALAVAAARGQRIGLSATAAPRENAQAIQQVGGDNHPGSPVDPSDGTAHYFGVGAYGRPLEDAHHSGVCFAAECLAFAVPPEPAAVRAWFGSDGPLDHASSAGRWDASVARDPGAVWSFEDTNNIYVRRLFLDPDSDPDAALARPAQAGIAAMLATHAQRLEYQRAALAHVFQRTFATWRSEASGCRGALVLAASSTAPGAGWGILDAAGHPTAAWYGMRRACAPVAVTFLPAKNGVPVHVFNDHSEPLHATLRLRVATVSGAVQPPIDVPVAVAPHGETVVRADLADGAFRDLDHAFGFGPREYNAVSAQLISHSGEVLARDVHLCGGVRRDDAAPTGVEAAWVHTNDEWAVDITAQSLARFVALDLPWGEDREAAVAADGYVHILPGETLRIPVGGNLTDTVLRATTVRILGEEAVKVRR